jgi:hypothetical protein
MKQLPAVVLNALDHRLTTLNVPMTLRTKSGDLLLRRDPNNVLQEDVDFLCMIADRRTIYKTGHY